VHPGVAAWLRLRFRDWRHGGVSVLSALGVDLKMVRERLGAIPRSASRAERASARSLNRSAPTPAEAERHGGSIVNPVALNIAVNRLAQAGLIV
jgi:hypothetical protein